MSQGLQDGLGMPRRLLARLEIQEGDRRHSQKRQMQRKKGKPGVVPIVEEAFEESPAEDAIQKRRRIL